MKRLLLVTAVIALLCASVAAQALVWNFTDAGDYYAGSNATFTAGSASVASIGTTGTKESAAVLAKVNTLAYHLAVGDITGGGFTLSAIGNPTAIYGSLYLSPDGASGSDVMINISPMANTGGVYTFDLTTDADYRTWDGSAGNWTAFNAARSGSFSDVIGMIKVGAYSNDYAAFFGPQASEIGTSSTPFTVTRIQLNTAAVPEPMSILLGIMGLSSIAGFRKLRRK